MRPVVAIYSTFLQRAYDQIIHDVCIQNLPVFFSGWRAGIVGADGPTIRVCTTLLICVASQYGLDGSHEAELQQMVVTGVNYTDGPSPCAIRAVTATVSL